MNGMTNQACRIDIDMRARWLPPFTGLVVFLPLSRRIGRENPSELRDHHTFDIHHSGSRLTLSGCVAARLNVVFWDLVIARGPPTPDHARLTNP